MQCAVTVGVFLAPWTVHLLDAPATNVTEEAAPSAQELDQLMRDMADQGSAVDAKKATE